jgi:nucleoside-diphosphate-sugar epimerase
MGPSLARLAKRSAEGGQRVIGVARFSVPGSRDPLEQAGVETIAADLLDRDAVAKLPDAPNVIYMVGQKFGTSGDQALTWATNVHAAGIAAERYRAGRIVAFSTGNVYPFTTLPRTPAPTEDDPTGPVGEYAQSALGRERILTYWSRRNGTPMAILRLNYAIEPRYGVLRDLADTIMRGEPVDLAMGYVNVIWQRDANAIALRCLSHCAVPPFVLNLTGARTLGVRELATGLSRRLGKRLHFRADEGDTALLSDASKCRSLFGDTLGVEEMLDRVAFWVKSGGPSLNKPTHFEEREGKF